MHHYIVLLSDLSYQLGLIGIAEYEERREIAYWLSNGGEGKFDPRGGRHDEPERPRGNDERSQSDVVSGQGGAGSSGDDPIDRRSRFIALNKWMFTVGDPDCYPSVPHGHFHRKTNGWPKLNPYTGRVFADVHAEDPSHRLTKAEMKSLWNDEDFVEHCRKQVLWYSDFAPEYAFPRARFGKLHFPKW
ncbi:hypothetical protein N5C72_24065 [Achromobacter mucicolens]|uniref:Uncharacterized protein n=1 Tax=Achromobacter mucicolens TaxID=1389922 RepID=A0ABD4Z177_9BURK|nr:hypothetical protein [Achromobacter mucicolens]MDH1181163.1 hypothetical protein [Achromobacter mucicolens]